MLNKFTKVKLFLVISDSSVLQEPLMLTYPALIALQASTNFSVIFQNTHRENVREIFNHL
jgi:hypothetical protein